MLRRVNSVERRLVASIATLDSLSKRDGTVSVKSLARSGQMAVAIKKINDSGLVRRMSQARLSSALGSSCAAAAANDYESMDDSDDEAVDIDA